jgi:hypothetical protein
MNWISLALLVVDGGFLICVMAFVFYDWLLKRGSIGASVTTVSVCLATGLVARGVVTHSFDYSIGYFLGALGVITLGLVVVRCALPSMDARCQLASAIH